MERRILPPEFENRPKLSPTWQLIVAATFVTCCLLAVALAVWLQA